MQRIVGLALALTLGLLPSVFAQVSGGNIYATVTDPSGGLLPGATVKLTSIYGSRETVAGPQGDFRFVNLERGNYTLTVSLPGFNTVTRDVIVNLGTNVNISFSLSVAAVAETVTVTAETPVVDTKRVGTGTTLSKEELADIPSARDPWAMLRAVPGIIMDRVNVGGNENGQQANFVGKGDNGDNVMWNLDGVNVTDSASLSSPSYYDFDAFEEVSVTTGGNDVRAQTGGVGINLTTRRGTNAFHGSFHDYLTSNKIESTNLPSQLVNDPRLENPDGSFRDTGDHIAQIADFGLEVGGPIVKDKLWFYGSWGRQDVRLVRLIGTSDKTVLTSYNAKLNWQASSADQVSLFYFNGEKTKEGRNVGFGIDEPDSFLWDQGGKYDGKLHGFIKAQWDHTFGQSFFLSAKVSNYDTGFFLHPRGGDINGAADFGNGQAYGAYYKIDNTRPAKTANIDASYFTNGMGGSHEFKFGFGYRRFNVTTTTHWGGDGLFGYKFGGGADYVHVSRDARNATQGDYLNVYVSDTFTKDRLTLNVGLRFDNQKAKNLPSSVPASALIPDILGALSWDGVTVDGRSDNPVPKLEFNDLSPRVGVTVALDESRKTVARASYARYASGLGAGQASFFSPFASPGSYFAYYWSDVNNDGMPTPNEVRTDLGPLYYGYVDPTDPSGPSKNKLGDFHAQHDNELIIGLERELIPDLAVSVAYTYRTGTGHLWAPRTGFTADDYSMISASTRNGYTATRYVPDHDKVIAGGNSRTLQSRPDYSRKFTGFEATIAKRLSHRWMGRVAFTYNNPTEYLDGPGAINNPTRTDTSGRNGNGGVTSGPQVNGGLYSPRSSGSGKGDAIIGAKWQIIANALVQLPYGFDLAGAFFGRQGHPYTIIAATSLGDDGSSRVLADGQLVDSQRYDNVYDLDLRLANNIKIGKTTLTLAADVFNVLNANTTLGLGRRFTSSQWSETNLSGAFGRTDEILNPRVVRLSARFSF